MVLFKNARDRQQIKTLAMQMYPQKWKNFLEYFEHETSKPYGKVIIDLRPNTRDEHRLVTDNKVNDLIVKQHEHQQRTLQYTNPNLAQAQETQENINSLLENPLLNDGQKASRYTDLMRDYQAYMLNATKDPQYVPPPHPILNFQSPISQTQVPTSQTLMVKKHEETPSSIRQLTHLSKISPPFFTGAFSTPPDSNMRLAAQAPLPLTSSDESEDDDPLSTFISFSDDETTRERKHRNAERKYNLRKKRIKKEQK